MRLHLILALITAFALVMTLRAEKKSHHFTFAQVQDLAEQRAEMKYVPLPDVLPPQLKNLSVEQENGIFWNDAHRVWRNKGLPFQVDFYHVNKAFPFAPQINTIDGKGSHPLPYSPSFFRFSGLTFNPPLPPSLGYAGFYLRYPINKPDSLDGFFSAQGASYFRVIAKDQAWGLTTRGLALNTEEADKKEEFPNFTDWWLAEPASNATEMVLYALLDGPSVTGAYEFKVRPGAQTSVDVHATLYFRKDVKRLGLAPMTSMYLFGENAKNHFGDNFHPEIHDSDGALMNKNDGDWVWRPLQQRPDLQLYSFPDKDPRGFGLIQRDRDFQHYQDGAAKYNIRPSAWVTPRGNWGKGSYQLIQLPTDNTNTDNVVLFWSPEQQPKAGDKLDRSYTVDYYMNDAERPPLAYCKETLVACPAPPPPAPPPPTPPVPASAVPVASKPAAATLLAPPAPVSPTGTVPVQFVIDFMGNWIENLPASQHLDLDITCNPPLTDHPPTTILRDWKVEKNDYDHFWRVTFTIIPFKHNVPTEILCRLKRDGKPLTETWSYTWHQ
jgi:glucans biosynthesis protein